MKSKITFYALSIILSSSAYAAPGYYTYRITNSMDANQKFELTATADKPVAVFSNETETQYIKSCENGVTTPAKIAIGRHITVESSAALSGNSDNPFVKVVFEDAALKDLQTIKNNGCQIQIPEVIRTNFEATVVTPLGKRAMINGSSNSSSKVEWFIERLN